MSFRIWQSARKLKRRKCAFIHYWQSFPIWPKTFLLNIICHETKNFYRSPFSWMLLSHHIVEKIRFLEGTVSNAFRDIGKFWVALRLMVSRNSTYHLVTSALFLVLTEVRLNWFYWNNCCLVRFWNDYKG